MGLSRRRVAVCVLHCESAQRESANTSRNIRSSSTSGRRKTQRLAQDRCTACVFDILNVGLRHLPAFGANLMQERTAFRLAMLANGFQPLLNDCKRSIEKGWPTKIVDEAEVRSWDRSALASTGLKLDGDLAVIDVDVSEAALVEALAGALDRRFPELFVHGLVRHAGGAKEAWIARTEEPFRRLASRRWYRGSDPDDPAVPKHLVECFGLLGTRQFAIDGPHARDRRGEVTSVYRFAGGASPATVPRAALPVLAKAAYAHACDRFDEIAAAAGLTAVRETRGEAAAM